MRPMQLAVCTSSVAIWTKRITLSNPKQMLGALDTTVPTFCKTLLR